MISGQRMLVVRVADPDKYVERGNALKRVLNRANTRMCGSPVVISANALQISFDELRAELASWLSRRDGAADLSPAARG